MVGYFLGFFAMFFLLGWHPHAPKHDPNAPPTSHGAVESGHGTPIPSHPGK